jgi:hypothetical protein
MTLDASGNWMVGATSALGRATIVQGASSNTDTLVLKSPNSSGAGSQPGIQFLRDTNAVLAKVFADTSTGALIVDVNGTERARIDSDGDVRIGTGNASNTVGPRLYGGDISGNYWEVRPEGDGSSASHMYSRVNNTANRSHIIFANPDGNVGSLTTSGSSTAYNTSSDYRLKENVQPMQDALAKIAQLNPVTYTWKADGSDGQGFIAHELQAVVPDCVSGEKDAVDAEGNPQYQGVDTSFLVATLVKAVQELTARIAALEAAQ